MRLQFINNGKQVIRIFTGILFLIPVCIEYLPTAMEQGMYEVELTFLSNVATGVLFLYGGIYGIVKKKELPQFLYLDSIILLQIVFFVSMVFAREFNFGGGFFFLHIINPIVATIEFLTFTNMNKIPEAKMLLTGLIVPTTYFIYVVMYGYLTGYWLYGILNVSEKGISFVAALVVIVGMGILVLEWIQYGICYLLSRKRNI